MAGTDRDDCRRTAPGTMEPGPHSGALDAENTVVTASADTPTGTTDRSTDSPDDPTVWPLGRLLSAAARRVEQDWDRSLASIGLTHAAVVVLHHLVESDAAALDDLARDVRVTPQTMSRTLGRMERDGLVERTVSASDRRRKSVIVTEKGRRSWYESCKLEARAVPIDRADDQLRDLLVGIVTADRG